MRGFKKDIQATKAAKFLDKRSFWSLPKDTHSGALMPHMILYGKDKELIRAEIFARNRDDNDGTNFCWNCHRLAREESEDIFAGEWDHILSGPGERCDCPENGRVSCRSCHSKRHVTPMFTVKQGTHSAA